ncbi:ATP-dependent Clp protease adaptor ClpS [Lentzea sp. HUAS TT2]|uniref:ATP-dependent Clp protease adaptor ClpS n=1 Tax=Lentzea sp. HUAS TT2 TaxID=3447454 RepID=UPI003F70ABAC
MISGERWQVVVHDDDVNTFALVHHILRTVCGQDDAQARERTLEIHRSSRTVMDAQDRSAAEVMAVRLARLGMRVSVGKAS